MAVGADADDEDEDEVEEEEETGSKHGPNHLALHASLVGHRFHCG